MKKSSFLFLFLLSALWVFPQGIEFRQGSWEDMLRMARDENKMVFTDFYTSWCGPCKMMSREVFVQEEIGNFFNRNFICYKLDAEKGEGKSVAQRYDIQSYPTFLFVDSRGEIFYRFIGYKEGAAFLEQGQKALQEFYDSKKTIAAWDAEYLKKKDKVDFVREYLQKREKTGLDNADILDQYFRIAKTKDLMQPSFLKTLVDQNARINADGPCFHFLINHMTDICPLFAEEEKGLIYSLQDIVQRYSMEKAIRLKDESILQAILTSDTFFVHRLNKNPLESRLLLLNDYYYGSGNQTAYEENARNLIQYYRSKEVGALSADSVQNEQFLSALFALPQKMDSIITVYSKWPEPLKKDLFWSMLYAIGHDQIRELAYQFSYVVSQAARISQNREFLLEVLSWAVESVSLCDHFSTRESLSEALYALKLRQEAIYWMKQAREMAIRDMGNSSGFAEKMLEKIERMENHLPLK